MATIGGVITTGAHPKALWPGIKTWWGRQYAEHQQEYPELFDIETSDKAYEEDVEISGFGVLREKDQGQALNYDTEVQGAITRYTHIAYAGGYIVTFEELRDNLYEVVSKRRAAMLAFAGRQTEEIIGANVFNQAFNASFPIGDGGAIAATTGGYANGNLVAGAGGSTVTGMSSWQLDSSTVATGNATYQVKVLGLTRGPDNAIGNYARWNVSLNLSALAQNTAGF